MSFAFQCDVCKKLFLGDPVNRLEGTIGMTTNKMVSLCKDCDAAFQRFLLGESVNHGGARKIEP